MSDELAKIKIPFPDEDLFDIGAGLQQFNPAPDLNEFIEQTFLEESNLLFNAEHIHLVYAHIGFLWTNVPNKRKMKRVVGEAEIPMFKGGAWQKARQERQFIDWFGSVPDFVITLDADFRREVSDIEFLALLEHELYHCGQAIDDYGFPRFSRTDGKPIYAKRGHDVEEFTGVVRRYGIGATGEDRVEFVAAAAAEPLIGKRELAQMCGTCL